VFSPERLEKMKTDIKAKVEAAHHQNQINTSSNIHQL
jgi:hypothetical protein